MSSPRVTSSTLPTFQQASLAKYLQTHPGVRRAFSHTNGMFAVELSDDQRALCQTIARVFDGWTIDSNTRGFLAICLHSRAWITKESVCRLSSCFLQAMRSYLEPQSPKSSPRSKAAVHEPSPQSPPPYLLKPGPRSPMIAPLR